MRSRIALLVVVLAAAMVAWPGVDDFGSGRDAMATIPDDAMASRGGVLSTMVPGSDACAVQRHAAEREQRLVAAQRRADSGDRASGSLGDPSPASGSDASVLSVGSVSRSVARSDYQAAAGGATTGGNDPVPYQPEPLPQVWENAGPQAMRINARVDLGFTFDPVQQGGRLSLQNASAEPFAISFHGDVAGVSLDGQRVEPGRRYLVRNDAELLATHAVGIMIRGSDAGVRSAAPDGNG